MFENRIISTLSSKPKNLYNTGRNRVVFSKNTDTIYYLIVESVKKESI